MTYKGKYPCYVCSEAPFVDVDGKYYCREHYEEILNERRRNTTRTHKD